MTDPCPVCGRDDCREWRNRKRETWHSPADLVDQVTQVTPEDFPKGFAETDGYGYLELCDDLRKQKDPGYVPPQRPRFPEIGVDLRWGEVYDVGLRHYGEFFASLPYAYELIRQPQVMLNGVPGTVTVVHRFSNVIQLKWNPAAAVAA